MQHTTDEYLETRVLTAGPEELHLMVVDGAVRHAARAEAAFQNHDFETAHFALGRAREFTLELISGLNAEQLPDLVRALRQLFGFAYRCLNEADLNRDVEKVRAALQVLRSHQETWRQLLQDRKAAAADHSGLAPGQGWTS